MHVSAEDGRIYLPKDLRERHGEEFQLIDRGDRLILVPLPEDPLAALRRETAGTDATAEELKERALAQALDEAGH